MAFVQLLSGKLENVEKKTFKLTNFPRNDNASALFPLLKYLDDAFESEF